ncbi:hypothetical protein I4U23_024745 [Adineta vaga]|nr:hypothetical protein I4U23_024745 [Adineta vaga]
MKELILILFILTKYSQQQLTTLFNCTFDSGLIDDCMFNGLIPFNDILDVDEGQTMIDSYDRPFSDVTSVFSPTINGDMCEFPYDLNGWPMHFCIYEENSNNYTCPTKSGNQTCLQGRYGYKTTSDSKGFVGIYKSNSTILRTSIDEQHCLRFYYYFTNNFQSSSISFRMHTDANITSSQHIVIVLPNDEQKWYFSQTTFTPVADEYYLIFVLLRRENYNHTTNFTFALDNISIINGPCESLVTASPAATTTTTSILSKTSTTSTKMMIFTTDRTTTTTTKVMSESSTSPPQTTRVMTTTTMISTETTTIPVITSVTTSELNNFGEVLRSTMFALFTIPIVTVYNIMKFTF